MGTPCLVCPLDCVFSRDAPTAVQEPLMTHKGDELE